MGLQHNPQAVQAAGVSRTDVFFDARRVREARGKLLQVFPAAAGRKVILYAPTFRDETIGGVQSADFSLSRALDALEAGTGDKWIALGRAHDLNAGGDFGTARCRDVTDRREMTELLLASDLLITDYSSCAGDFILLRRPVILYQPERASFEQTNRRLYFKMEDCPHLQARNEEELFNMLKDFNRLPDVSDAVGAFYGMRETGHATQSVCDWIEKHL